MASSATSVPPASASESVNAAVLFIAVPPHAACRLSGICSGPLLRAIDRMRRCVVTQDLRGRRRRHRAAAMNASRRRLARSNSRASFGHWRRAAERESPLAARWPLRAEGHSRCHGMDSRTLPEGCTRLVPWASASPAAPEPQTPMPRLVPLPTEGRRWYRLVPAARARRTFPGASVPTA